MEEGFGLPAIAWRRAVMLAPVVAAARAAVIVITQQAPRHCGAYDERYQGLRAVSRVRSDAVTRAVVGIRS